MVEVVGHMRIDGADDGGIGETTSPGLRFHAQRQEEQNAGHDKSLFHSVINLRLSICFNGPIIVNIPRLLNYRLPLDLFSRR